jgi:hypothetical protein
MATYPMAAWFETRGVAALLTMRVEDLILRSIAKRCVSKDEATQLEYALTCGYVHHLNAVEHLMGLVTIEVAFPCRHHDGGDAVADQVAECARHADEPVDR